MLDRTACISLLQSAEMQKPFNIKKTAFLHAKRIIDAVRDDRALQMLLLKENKQITWKDDLFEAYQLPDAFQGPYRAIGVDGSQIYPDVHQGNAVALINIGVADMAYDYVSKARLFADPFLYHVAYAPCSILQRNQYVDLLRTFHEIQKGFELYQALDALTKKSAFLLFDGVLSYYASLSTPLAHRLANVYMSLDEQLVPYGAYQSMPSSVFVVRLVLKAAQLLGEPFQYEAEDMLIDADLVPLFLPVGYRSTLFVTASQTIVVFIHLEQELIKLELPFFFFAQSALTSWFIACIVDQVKKGSGYPVILTEAHEQAVIRESDRMFFMHAYQQAATDFSEITHRSQKYFKKRVRYV